MNDEEEQDSRQQAHHPKPRRATHQLEQLLAVLGDRLRSLPHNLGPLEELVHFKVRLGKRLVSGVEDAPLDGLLDAVNGRVEAVLGVEPLVSLAVRHEGQ